MNPSTRSATTPFEPKKMAPLANAPAARRPRLKRFIITSLLMGLSFATGVAVTAVIAARLVLPIAATGLTMGMVGLATASTNATVSALYSGDSEMRLTVLTQLKLSFDSQPEQKIDSQTAAWILPAIETCKTDNDPRVVELADEVIAFISEHMIEIGQQP